MNKKAAIVPAALSIIAGLTPDYYDIQIIDEALGLIKELPDADLIGITTLTGTIARVYELSAMFKEKGIPVVLGGIHASMVPDESIQKADAVVIGEAELTWNRVLKDFEEGKLGGLYKSNEIYDFSKISRHRWDLIEVDQYLTFSIQATRGCPYDCEFCGVTKIYGPQRRHRDINDVVNEIKSLPTNKFIFADDNLTFNKDYARDLMAAIKPLNVTWNCQSSIDLADFDDLISDMAEAGCEQVLIGLESLNPQSLEETNKNQNLKKDYKEVLHAFHKHGIFVGASFIFGFDHDTKEDLDRIVKFTEEAPAPMALVTPLASLPGSRLTERLKKEGRILHLPVDMIGSFYPSIIFKNFTGKELFLYYSNALKKMFSYESALIKAKKLFGQGDFARISKHFDIPVSEKARVSLYLMQRFLITRNKTKRELFLYLFRLFRNKTLAVERLVYFLLYIEGARVFLNDEIWGKEKEHLKKIEKYCKV